MARRIVIKGTSGVGKTTFGAELAARLGVPFIELDALHHAAANAFGASAPATTTAPTSGRTSPALPHPPSHPHPHRRFP